jgi:hypothetical protein
MMFGLVVQKFLNIGWFFHWTFKCYHVQNWWFWKEKSVQDVVTLECLPFNSTRRNCDVPSVLLERPCNGIGDMVTLGPMAQVTLVYLWRKVVCLFCLYLWDPRN